MQFHYLNTCVPVQSQMHSDKYSGKLICWHNKVHRFIYSAAPLNYSNKTYINNSHRMYITCRLTKPRTTGPPKPATVSELVPTYYLQFIPRVTYTL